MNFVHPTPIQTATIPFALMGRDICGCAATGTGKTAAYMLPTLERLLYRPLNGPAISRVLVLVPTRELGVQVYQVTKQLSQFTTVEVGLSVGGLDVKIQVSKFYRITYTRSFTHSKYVLYNLLRVQLGNCITEKSRYCNCNSWKIDRSFNKHANFFFG